MSNHLKSSLLGATAVAIGLANPAYAQLVFPAAELHAAGATSVQDVLPKEFTCVSSTKFAAGTSVQSFTVNADATVSARNYGNGSYTGTDGAFDCSAKSIQPNISVRYIGTGSGSGRKLLTATTFGAGWTAIAPQVYSGGTLTSTPIAFPNAAVFGSDVSTWTVAHFAMSDGPMGSSDFSTFAANHASAGASVQFPLYVVPVALGYSPVYAIGTSNGKTYTFNIQNGGTLHLSKRAYCGIFNGTIKNWNSPYITATNIGVTGTVKGKPVNGAIALFDTTNDTAARWSAEGAPIRLVGRADGSGTTDIFSRHLASVCGSADPLNTNKFTNAGEQLPYAAASGIDMRWVRGDSPYFPTSTKTFAGTTNTLTGIAYVNNTTGFADLDLTPGHTALTEGVTVSATAGTNGSGKFIVASGGGNVAKAILSLSASVPGSGITSADGSMLFNGKIGYISADNVQPANASGPAAAALEIGSTYANGTGKKPAWALPTAATANAAFGKTVLPPESDAKGTYVAGSTPGLTRANPADWYNALYVAGSPLSNPSVGYPMTGTTQFNTGTCFKDPAVRNAITAFLLTTLGNNVLDSTGAKVSKNLFTGIKTGVVGIREQIAFAPLPASWTKAIVNTFLTKSKDAGTLGLFIQNGLPTAKGLGKNVGLAAGGTLTAAQLPTAANYSLTVGKKTLTGLTEAEPNPACTAGQGL